MRNKGAILTLAIALTLVCIYQLSFTWKAASIRNQITELSKNDPVKQEFLSDSLSGTEVYNILVKKFTFREVQERELNFGLDLKGGMNIILEVSVADVIKALSNHSTDSTFSRALALTRKMQTERKEDFLTLFGEAFTQVDPNARLSAIFNTVELRDKINYSTSNEQVLAIIRDEAKGAIDNAFNIISTRIDQFGVTQPNIQRLEGGDRILVDLPGVKNKERVRKLLQGTANLEFWETYENAQIIEGLNAANEIIYNYEKTQSDLKKDSLSLMSSASPAKETNVIEQKEGAELSLLDQIKSDTSKSEELNATGADNKYPLFSLLMPLIDRETGQPYPGSIIGRAHFRDTTKINFYLRLAKERNILPRDAKFLWSALPIRDPQTHKSTEIFELYAIKVTSRNGTAPLDGSAIVSAAQEFDQVQGNAYVLMNMNGEGAKKWARITKENLGKVICVVMDDKVFSGPTVQSEITGGSSQITGSFTVNEAMDLANLLKSGKLPAPAHIIQETVVGPSLGEKAVEAGLTSFMIAFFLILVFMIIWYGRRAGMVANFALVANLFFLIGVLASLGAALTLSGIAGIVLTLGMAVDANVLIYERAKEELASGKNLRMAVADGFKGSFSAIIDGNVTTLITGIILYIVGQGPIKGFATTLVIGICTSLFSAIFISRIIMEWYLSKNIDIKFKTKLSEGFLRNVNFDFLGKRRTFYILSTIIVIIGIISMFTRGLDFGVDFKGGRNFVILLDKQIKTADVAQSLTKEFGSTTNVIAFGSDQQIRVTSRYKVNEDDIKVDEEIQQKLYNSLKPYLENGKDYETFMNVNWQSNVKVGPSIADDIQRKAVYAIVLAMIMMFVYIAFRFKDWHFGLGAVVALIHDAFFVITIFSLFYGFLPFSLEIDQAFIAAILTVVGYSINDTVVIFDRLREYIGLYPKRDRKEVMNMAVNSTLGRTFSTNLTVVLVLAAIFIFGGEVIRGFIFAMFLGSFIGIYSTVFIATPIVYDSMKRREGKKKIN